MYGYIMIKGFARLWFSMPGRSDSVKPSPEPVFYMEWLVVVVFLKVYIVKGIHLDSNIFLVGSQVIPNVSPACSQIQ